jgi:hypothetical protein
MKSTAILTAVVLLFSTSFARASSCAHDLASAQALLLQEGRTAAEGPQLSSGAQLHHQPTPGSVGSAEASHNPSILLRALDALNIARAADQAGDAATCESKLAEMRNILAGY